MIPEKDLIIIRLVAFSKNYLNFIAKQILDAFERSDLIIRPYLGAATSFCKFAGGVVADHHKGFDLIFIKRKQAIVFQQHPSFLCHF
jgi:hypothetical protein